MNTKDKVENYQSDIDYAFYEINKLFELLTTLEEVVEKNRQDIKCITNMLDFAFYEINTLFRHLTPLEEEVEKLKKEVEKIK